MTMMSESYFLYVLLAANATLLGIACIAVLKFERRWRRIESWWDSPTGTLLNESCDDELREQIEATKRLEKKLGELQRTIKIMDMKPPQQSPPVERNLPMENALRMARLGASVEDLTRTCGLNVGEARLMQRLHGKDAAATTNH